MVLHAGPSDRGRPAQPQGKRVWEHWAAECATKREGMDKGQCDNCPLFTSCQNEADTLLSYEVNASIYAVRHKKAKKAKKEKVH